MDGLTSTGVNVCQVGLGPTPMLYFAVKHLKAAGGIMITGSHNPPDYNGFKMMLYTGPVYGDQIQELGQIVADGQQHVASTKGTVETLDIIDTYITRMLADFKTGGRKLKVAWDCGNGSAGEVIQRLTKRLDGEHILLFVDIDGDFPNHHPDPTVPKNLVDLQKCVAENNCDFGIAFDGDGDRIGVVDCRGRIVWGDQLLAVYARAVLAKNPNATIIADVKASEILFDEIKRLGGVPLMWKTGHSLIKAKMAETGSPLAGEMSGHIFFADTYYGFDDAPYCAVRLLSQLSHSTETLEVMVDSLPKVLNTPEIRIEVLEERKFAIIEEVRNRLAQQTDVTVNDIDGVRVSTKDGWWLLRASNTQNVLVARAESQTEIGLQALKQQISKQLAASGIADLPPEL